VETDEELELTTALSCDIIQGYYYSRALPQKELIIFIADMGYM
jgi:EAL domain-containing protein (putative c-di-GMP-specific phosphodiesterase class I)